MKLIDVKSMFPHNDVSAYHKETQTAVDSIEDGIPENLVNATVTHFYCYDDKVIAYCKG